MKTPSQTSTITSDGTTYTGYRFSIGKVSWSVVKVFGRWNYVTVKKETNNPYGIFGKEFESFDKALGHYKNVKMKEVLRWIQEAKTIV